MDLDAMKFCGHPEADVSRPAASPTCTRRVHTGKALTAIA
jgi:hypothetical protein